ncbi:MAG: type II secretion system F family protein [Candidatus Wallbacteria bacterium]|nr:type II secretion system F family protein [Candidatus Wallbacteria bacterium]
MNLAMIVLLLAVPVVLAVMFWPDKEKKELQKRLDFLTKGTSPSGAPVITSVKDEELQKSFKERIILPILRSFGKSSKKKTDVAKKEKLKKELSQAGNPGDLTVEEFLALRTVLTLLFLFVSELACFLIGTPVIHYLLAGIISVMLATLIPNIYLQKRIAMRKHLIQRKLPDVLDLLTVSIEAGLGFDAGMSKVVEKFRGPLAEEFQNVLNEVKLGKKRRDSLKDMAEKMEVDDLSNFISSLVQAESLGVSIGNVLRIQSAQARQRRRQRAEEAAMKAPIKMMLPLVGCVFPTIFIIIFTPIVISVYLATKK